MRVPVSGAGLTCAGARAAGIRDHMVQAVELKFNCFLLMPVVDAFPSRLRAELEARPAAALGLCFAAIGTSRKKVVMGCMPSTPGACATWTQARLCP
jgi:hypothetical protein